jgi:uncharacterized protein YigE (DUF2233 family)
MVDVLFDSATDEIKLFMGKPNGDECVSFPKSLLAEIKCRCQLILVSDKKAIYTNSYRTQSYPDYDR